MVKSIEILSRRDIEIISKEEVKKVFERRILRLEKEISDLRIKINDLQIMKKENVGIK